MRKKLFSILLSLAMVITMMPAMSISAFGTESSSQSVVVLLKAKVSGRKAIKLSWTKADNATKYVLYGARCGKSYKKLTSLKSNTYTVKKIKKQKLKAHKTYKFYVVAYKGSKKLATSKVIHFITGTTKGKYANVKSIKVNKTKATLKVGKTLQLKVTKKIYYKKKHISKAHGAATKFITNNPKVATVSKSGKIKAVGVGKATIYTQDIGGRFCKTTITVKAKTPTPVTTYTVTFDLNGVSGNAPVAQTVESGGKVTWPTPPTDATGILTFYGWYKTKNITTGELSDEWDFAEDTVTTDMTLYARWEEIKTIGEILNTVPDFPTSTNGAWVTEGNLCYKDGNSLSFYNNELARVISNPTTLYSAVKSGSNYVFRDSDLTITFTMTEGGVLKKITFYSTSTDTAAPKCNGTYVAMPAKGDLITLPGVSANASNELEKFRVIKVNGNEVELLAMSGKSMAWHSDSSNKTTFTLSSGSQYNGGAQYLKYDGSDIDTYLNSSGNAGYYGQLPADVKAAIMPQTNLKQGLYGWSDVTPSGTEGIDYWPGIYTDFFGVQEYPYYVINTHASASMDTKYVYALDVQDVMEYLGTDNLAYRKIRTLFFGSEDQNPGCCWLRSASTRSDHEGIGPEGYTGSLGSVEFESWMEARAAFTIDLSKVDYDIVTPAPAPTISTIGDIINTLDSFPTSYDDSNWKNSNDVRVYVESDYALSFENSNGPGYIGLYALMDAPATGEGDIWTAKDLNDNSITFTLENGVLKSITLPELFGQYPSFSGTYSAQPTE